VDFRESVRVVWPGENSGVLARAVNLSAAGILLDAPTPTPCPVGSDVLCDVPLPQGARLLRGRVAHRRDSSAKVGMGIEFVDLSDNERAELRGLVADGDEKPQRVKVRFEGTNQVVRARAHATSTGFRLATALPFLRAGTGMDVSLAPDVDVMRAWVSAVALDRSNPDGVPRLVIDVLVHPRDPWDVATPVVETLEAVPERVWELDELDPRPTPAAALAEVPIELEEEVPTIVTAGPSLPEIIEGSVPASEGADATQVISIDRVPGRWSAMRAGALAGVLALATFVVIVIATRSAPPGPAAPVSISPPVIVTQPRAPEPTPPPPAAEPAPPVAAAEPAAAPAPAVAAPEPAVEASGFDVDLEGSTAGAQRYLLRAPDGVGFNLPHARPSMKLGTYHPDVDGLRAVWLRPLPHGGTNARFYFKPGAPAPRVELRDGLLRVLPHP
jgi:hypothetical protein